MNKLAKVIAAVHAGVAAAGAFAAPVSAQDGAEVRAYMEAVKSGTPEAIMTFLQAYPRSKLPGSELGAKIASSLGAQPTSGAAKAGPRGAGAPSSSQSSSPSRIAATQSEAPY